MKKYASVKIRNKAYDKNITIETTACNDLIEVFRKIQDTLTDNCLLAVGDELEFINFYKTEEISHE